MNAKNIGYAIAYGGAELVPQVQPQINKPLVTSALEKLGAERVLRGHVALEHGGDGWKGCFLALCFGGYGKLEKLTSGGFLSTDDSTAADVLGLTLSETWAVVDAFDNCRSQMQELVEEWLELNYRPWIRASGTAIAEWGVPR
jgi:hypothetical protein